MKRKTIIIIAGITLALGTTAFILKKKGICCKKKNNHPVDRVSTAELLLGLGKMSDYNDILNEDIKEVEEPDLQP